MVDCRMGKGYVWALLWSWYHYDIVHRIKILVMLVLYRVLYINLAASLRAPSALVWDRIITENQDIPWYDTQYVRQRRRVEKQISSNLRTTRRWLISIDIKAFYLHFSSSSMVQRQPLHGFPPFMTYSNIGDQCLNMKQGQSNEWCMPV